MRQRAVRIRRALSTLAIVGFDFDAASSPTLAAQDWWALLAHALAGHV